MKVMKVKRNYRVSADFDRKLQNIQLYLKEVCGLDYTFADIFDEMMELYETRIKFNSNILNELFREHDEAILNQFMVGNAEMLNALKEIIKKSKV